MTDIWLTADLHLGHRALIDGFGDGRPGPRAYFKTVEEHDEAIVAHFNEIVKPQDKLYILGDIALSRKGLSAAERLQGKLRAVLGNHDQDKPSYYAHLFQKVYGAKCMDGMILTHIPVHPSTLTRRSMQVNVHGHLHDQRVQQAAAPSCSQGYPDFRYLCVSLEQTNFRPIHIDQVKATFGSLLSYPS